MANLVVEVVQLLARAQVAGIHVDAGGVAAQVGGKAGIAPTRAQHGVGDLHASALVGKDTHVVDDQEGVVGRLNARDVHAGAAGGEHARRKTHHAGDRVRVGRAVEGEREVQGRVRADHHVQARRRSGARAPVNAHRHGGAHATGHVDDARLAGKPAQVGVGLAPAAGQKGLCRGELLLGADGAPLISGERGHVHGVQLAGGQLGAFGGIPRRRGAGAGGVALGGGDHLGVEGLHVTGHHVLGTRRGLHGDRIPGRRQASRNLHLRRIHLEPAPRGRRHGVHVRELLRLAH